jgi:hypothetical protein
MRSGSVDYDGVYLNSRRLCDENYVGLALRGCDGSLGETEIRSPLQSCERHQCGINREATLLRTGDKTRRLNKGSTLSLNESK